MEAFTSLDSSQIKSFSISVTEEIQEKYLLTFLRTHIENQNFLLNDSSYFYYYFHKSQLRYEVIVFDKTTSEDLPLIFALKKYSDSQNNTVFLIQGGFCLYKADELVLFKKVDNVVIEDIKEYISQVYDIKVHNFIPIEVEESQKLLIDYQESPRNIFPYKESKVYRYFLYFFIGSTLVFLLLLYGIYNKKLTEQYYENSKKNGKQLEQQTNKIMQYKQFEKQNPLPKLIPLFEVLNSLKIKILKLEYRQDNIAIQLVHVQKQELLNLLKREEFTLHTKSIYFEKSLQSHILEIEFVF